MERARAMKMNIRKGDTVKVISGRDKGKQGEALSVSPTSGKVVVHQVNMARKAVKPDPKKNPQGGIIEMPAPIQASNLKLVCPRCEKPTKVKRSKDAEGKSSRKCGKCGELIDG
ncbi:MAG TPA: 50S ribosomal protein L24 [bacterium]|nr:MAG: 50S ribosomal protein L24 [bacterium ADurb.Bin236]HOC92632.1 50S ribosomal protein L24 [bacterium]HOY62214.1 50S ribosomal protein L24 [bacterium]HPI75438.1 50S ribosomal protein L24 [bacterium]HPN93433.1 50S ribosomal protein L24 [bacterium]